MSLDAVLASVGLLNFLALGGVVLIGLPHGAFDGAIAAYLGYAGKPLLLLRFLFLYVLIAGLVVAIWMVQPSLSLIVFLAISIVHFGLGDARATHGWFRLVQAVAHGGIIVAGISQSHRPEVDQIFGYLVGADTAAVWMAVDLMSAIIGAAFLVYAWRAFWDVQWRLGMLEMLFALLLIALLPPLVSFALYFCFVHSARHLSGIWRSAGSMFGPRILYAQSITFTVASWVAGGVAFWWCASEMSAESALLRVIFIGLAALTVPHMILVDALYRKHAVSP